MLHLCLLNNAIYSRMVDVFRGFLWEENDIIWIDKCWLLLDKRLIGFHDHLEHRSAFLKLKSIFVSFMSPWWWMKTALSPSASWLLLVITAVEFEYGKHLFYLWISQYILFFRVLSTSLVWQQYFNFRSLCKMWTARPSLGQPRSGQPVQFRLAQNLFR